MATLIAPSNHPPVEDTESLRKAVKGNLSNFSFPFQNLFNQKFSYSNSMIKFLNPSFSHNNQ